MNELVQARNAARDLMLRALEILDRIGEHEAATDLQQAIDTLVGLPVSEVPEEAEAALKTPEARRILARMDRRAAIQKL